MGMDVRYATRFVSIKHGQNRTRMNHTKKTLAALQTKTSRTLQQQCCSGGPAAKFSTAGLDSHQESTCCRERRGVGMVLWLLLPPAPVLVFGVGCVLRGGAGLALGVKIPCICCARAAKFRSFLACGGDSWTGTTGVEF